MIDIRKFIKAGATAGVLTAIAITGASQSWAAGSHGDGHDDGGKSVIGEPGKAAKASRTIEITLQDSYFEPESISVKKGETVRFLIKNAGEFVHEFNIGTSAMHAAHQNEMVKMMEHGALEEDKINLHMMKMDMGNGQTMEHNDPNSVLLEPGKSGEVVWKFTNAAKIEFACNVPGHYEAGMMGNFQFN